ncbi:hypothetical protein [Halorarum halobium]|uniref:hypothetical protein n=1 Tax=Halorarum halobium TaxID=3075121 RepID=UPI0028A9342F|nr:hypothetical protein [Halobaculum sp. XH14]
MESAPIAITGVENTSSFGLLVCVFFGTIAFVLVEISRYVRRRDRLVGTEIGNRRERFDEIIRSSWRQIREARDLPDCDCIAL